MRKIQLILLLVIACWTIIARAQQPSPFDDHAAPHYQGSTACAQCHVAPQTKSILDEVVDFVSLNEYRIWLNKDPHSRAYVSIIPEREHFDEVCIRLSELNRAVDLATGFDNSSDSQSSRFVLPKWGLSNERSQQILKKMFADDYSQSIGQLFQEITNVQMLAGKRLKEEQLVGFTPRLKATLQQCLSCHAGWQRSRTKFDGEIMKYGTGVGCESCHGPSSSWIESHVKSEWRTIDPRQKEAQFGMVDLRNPVSRARQCFSCHIGNVEQGKVITHEMYAAGHPPLPGIEIESFADQMPRHWRYLSEKRPDFEFATEFKKFYGLNSRTGESLEWNADEFPRTKNLLVAGVMASAHSIDLLAQLSNSNQIEWPEFAAFDCAACHHDLKANGGWQRQFAGIPGRPPAPYWTRSLTALGAAYLDSKSQDKWSDRLAAEQQEFQSVLDRQPFGIPADLKRQGSQYSNWLRNELANAIEIEPFDQEDATAVLQLLVGSNAAVFSPQEETRDFHSSRQLAWAIDLVYSEILQQPRRNEGKSLLSNQQAVPGNEFETVLGQMRTDLVLVLPETGAVTDQQQAYLARWSSFDQTRFLAMLHSLREALDGSGLPGIGINNNAGVESPDKG